MAISKPKRPSGLSQMLTPHWPTSSLMYCHQETGGRDHAQQTARLGRRIFFWPDPRFWCSCRHLAWSPFIAKDYSGRNKDDPRLFHTGSASQPCFLCWFLAFLSPRLISWGWISFFSRVRIGQARAGLKNFFLVEIFPYSAVFLISMIFSWWQRSLFWNRFSISNGRALLQMGGHPFKLEVWPRVTSKFSDWNWHLPFWIVFIAVSITPHTPIFGQHSLVADWYQFACHYFDCTNWNINR